MNEYIAATIDELYELGVREAVLSPGSRSTPLSVLFCEHKFKVYLDIDERSAGFFALGIAKEKNRPVVLVCTSGSAATHYFPAVAEAKHSRVPLIILTADRPKEFQKAGAPQTIDQVRIFGDFVNYFEEMAIPDENLYHTYPRLVMRKAFLNAQGGKKGPVQINIPLREPLFPDLSKSDFSKGRLKDKFHFESGILRTNFDCSGIIGKRGIIVCGGDGACTCQEKIIELAERLNTPVLADPLSNVRSYESDLIIDSYDAFLKIESAKKELVPDYIFMFGQMPVSKRLQKFIGDCTDAEFYQIDKSIDYRNSSFTTTYYIQADTEEFIKAVTVANLDDTFLQRWQKWQKAMRTKLDSVCEEEEIFEGKIVSYLQKIMPHDSRLAVANSMSIRDIDYFWRAKKQQIKVLCNRGTNGIDGTISTALGISTNEHPTVLLTGDLSFYHDMNGLLVGKTHHLHLVVVLFNNDGGGIFQYLPQRGQKYFDYLFSTPHGIDFAGIQQLYGIKYKKISGYAEFETSFKKAIHSTGITVLEVNTRKERSRELHEKYTTL